MTLKQLKKIKGLPPAFRPIVKLVSTNAFLSKYWDISKEHAKYYYNDGRLAPAVLQYMFDPTDSAREFMIKRVTEQVSMDNFRLVRFMKDVDEAIKRGRRV